MNKSTPKTHELKTLPLFFEPLIAGSKTFEYRLNDRGFQVGDKLILREFDREEYTGRNFEVRITYILDQETWPGFIWPAGFVILGFKPVVFTIFTVYDHLRYGNNRYEDVAGQALTYQGAEEIVKGLIEKQNREDPNAPNYKRRVSLWSRTWKGHKYKIWIEQTTIKP